jgi:tetratricopeptide (TPR) repeat protein
MPKVRTSFSKTLIAVLTAAIVSVCGALFALHVSETQLQGLFAEGNNFYKEGKYAQALQSYEQILAARGNDPVVLYNAGNAYAKSNNPGKAVLYYERARRFLPRDPDIAENLRRIEPATNRSNPFFLFRPLFFIRDVFTENELTLIADALLFLVLFSVTLMLLTRNERAKRIASRLTKILLPLLIIAVIFFAWKTYEQDILRQAIVVTDKAVARSGPGEQFLEVLELPAGTKVLIVEKDTEDWVRIRLRDGRSGYLQSSACEQI